jgi:uncharacterized protein YuzE
MPNEFKADFDEKEDLLFIYNPKKKSKGSAELGELIIDFGIDGGIAGLEIFEASKYLSELTGRKISIEQLKEVENAGMTVNEKKGTLIIKIILAIENEKVPATIAVQNMHYKSPILAKA